MNLKQSLLRLCGLKKSVVSCETRDRSPDSASCEAKIVSDCKTISALHKAKPRLSCEVRAKALVLTARLLQPRLHHQHYWAVLGSPLATKPKH